MCCARFASGWRLAWSTALLLVAVILSGCVVSKQEPLVPSIVGVVEEVEQLAGRGRTFSYRLEEGEVVEIDLATAEILGGPGGPGEGNLLLTGTNPSGRTWVLGLPRHPVVESHPGCFRLEGTGIGVDGWVDLSNGLRLKKAADFEAENLDPDLASDERYVMERFAFCLNSRGEVTSYGV